MNNENNTLHKAIRIILEESENRINTTTFISDEINKRELYRKKDGSRVKPFQIYLRADNYPDLFDVIDRNTIKLKKDINPIDSVQN